MKRTLIYILFSLVLLCSCSKGDSSIVTIFTSAESFRVDVMREKLKDRFPDYNILIEYYPSGNHAAKLASEGKNTECDITYDIDYGYYQKIKGILAPIEDVDISQYDESAIIVESDSSIYLLPEYKNSGCIAINTEVFKEKNLPLPSCYEDLLNPIYKGLISMPNPKSSGTGYIFLKLLVNEFGEEEAFKYFDELSKNILQFTTSGSGPVNALVQKEAAIGLAMTGQVVEEIQKGAQLEIIWFDEGAPYGFYGTGIIKGKEEKECVQEVFKYLNDEYIPYERALYFPEKIYADKDFEIDGYPENIVYGDMSGNTPEEKERLLSKWKY